MVVSDRKRVDWQGPGNKRLRKLGSAGMAVVVVVDSVGGLKQLSTTQFSFSPQASARHRFTNSRPSTGRGWRKVAAYFPNMGGDSGPLSLAVIHSGSGSSAPPTYPIHDAVGNCWQVSARSCPRTLRWPLETTELLQEVKPQLPRANLLSCDSVCASKQFHGTNDHRGSHGAAPSCLRGIFRHIVGWPFDPEDTYILRYVCITANWNTRYSVVWNLRNEACLEATDACVISTFRLPFLRIALTLVCSRLHRITPAYSDVAIMNSGAARVVWYTRLSFIDLQLESMLDATRHYGQFILVSPMKGKWRHGVSFSSLAWQKYNCLVALSSWYKYLQVSFQHPSHAL
ncbi:hypothetical protein V8B97DRAFT_1446461 [Scleroderma yunnanense]